MRSVASPRSRVRGAWACRAERSRSRVRRARACSGQACRGCSRAESSASCAGWPALGGAWSVASSVMAWALPPSVSSAPQGVRAAPAAGASVAFTSSGSGARVPTCAVSAACTPAAVATRRPMRWAPPGRGSTTRPSSAMPVAAGWASICSVSMRARARFSASGGAMLSGSGIGRGPGGPVFTCTDFRCSSSMSSASQASGPGRQRQRRPSMRRPCSSARARPWSQLTTRWSACQRPLSSAPCQPCTETPGSCCSSQRVPASRCSSTCSVVASPSTSSSATAATQASGVAMPSAVSQGRAWPLARAAAGAAGGGGAAGGWGSFTRAP